VGQRRVRCRNFQNYRMRLKNLSGLRCASCIGIIAFVFASKAALPAPDPDDGGLVLPPGFRAIVVADKLGPTRFITVATNGDIYVKKTRAGVIGLRDTKGDGRADVVRTFGNEVGGGTGVAVRNQWLYVSSNDAVYRYKLNPGELVPTDAPEAIVVGLPPGQRQHEAKAFAFDESNHLYVEVGCPSNSSGDPDRAPGAKGVDPAGLFVQHGGFWRFDADKTNQDQVKDGFHFSTGMRHSVSVAWNPDSKALFITLMGRDQLNTVDGTDYTAEDNADRPAEEFHILKEGSNFGWPYTYFDFLTKKRMLSPEFGGDNKKADDSGKYPDPLVALPAHWAFLQMAYYNGTQFPEKYQHGMFIASHGSWNRAPLPQAGYKVVYLPFNKKGMPDGSYEIFADNFAGVAEVHGPNDAQHRPCGLAVGPDGSLYVSDSEKGKIWRIIYTGEMNTNAQKMPVAAPAANAPVIVAETPGAKLYRQGCATCHMADGGGVGTMQPPLMGSKVVAGNPVQLIHVVLEGPDKVLPADRVHYSNKMPAMDMLSDEQVANVLTYIRQRFGGGASAIQPSQVAAERRQ